MKNGITPAGISALMSGDLENFIAASTPGGIEAQESRGQKDFVANEILPKDSPWKELESLGFKIGDEYDDIFLNVKIPNGWKKEATDHSMWSHLLDDKGRVRASIFYKAAFYDRSAKLHLARRFHIQRDYDIKDAIIYLAKDGEEVVYKTAAIKFIKEYDDEYFKIDKELNNEAILWLKSKYPEYENPMKYWD